MRAGAPALRSWCRCLILDSRVALDHAGGFIWDGSQTDVAARHGRACCSARRPEELFFREAEGLEVVEHAVCLGPLRSRGDAESQRPAVCLDPVG
eukprot:1222321-Heterocapsa_arctica.AAC.1